MYEKYSADEAKRYAAINVPFDTERHFRRVEKWLKPKRGDKLLEIGCGKGFLVKRTQEVAPDTIGIDLNPESIARALTTGLAVGNAEKLDFADASFDALYCIHTIHTVPDLRGALREMARVTKPGGRILIAYPAEPIRGLFALPNAIAVFKNPLRAREVHLHRLSPWICRKLIADLPLDYVGSEFSFLTVPQWYTVFRRR